MSYPSAVVSFSSIVVGTTLEAGLLIDTAVEAKAVQAVLGTNIHGSAGSLADRLRMFCGDFGTPYGNLKQIAGSDNVYRSLRAGVTVVNVDDLDVVTSTNRAEGTFTFSPPLAALPANCHAFVNLQLIDDAVNSTTNPLILNYIANSGTTTSFDFAVCTNRDAIPAAGTSFIMHWCAIERAVRTTPGF